MAERVEEGELQRIYDKEYFESKIKDNHMVAYEGKYRQYSTTAISLIRTFSPKNVLDVGCGRGELVHAFIDLGIEAYGVDVSQYAISTAKERVKEKQRRDVKEEEQPFYILDIEEVNLPFQDSYFDLITIFEVIEHLHSYEHCLNEIKRVLNPEGHFIIATHKPESIYSSGDETHANIQAREEWIELFKKHGFFEIEDFDQRFKKYAVSKPPVTEKGREMIEKGEIEKRAQYVRERLEREQIIIIANKKIFPRSG